MAKDCHLVLGNQCRSKNFLSSSLLRDTCFINCTLKKKKRRASTPVFFLILFWKLSFWAVAEVFFFFFFFFFWSFCLFRAAPTAYGGSQARGLIGVLAAGLHHSYSNATSASATYSTAPGNAGFLTHWARPEIEPTTSWFLVRFVSAVPRWEVPYLLRF